MNTRIVFLGCFSTGQYEYFIEGQYHVFEEKSRLQADIKAENMARQYQTLFGDFDEILDKQLELQSN